jgi:hypothetical protein
MKHVPPDMTLYVKMKLQAVFVNVSEKFVLARSEPTPPFRLTGVQCGRHLFLCFVLLLI